MDVDKDWFKKQLFAIVYRTAHESELTLREMVHALHEVAEHVMFLEEKKPDVGLRLDQGKDNDARWDEQEDGGVA